MYEYHGMMAKTWDLFRGDTSAWEDRFFFQNIIQMSGQPCLDVGCGTGRLLLDYLSQGIDIDGLDISPEMLDLCRKKAKAMGMQPVLFEASIEKMNLPRRYMTIIVPSSSFQLVVDPQSAKEAMQQLYHHLLPGGMLVMPFMMLWKRGDALESPWQQTGEKTRPEDGAIVRRWSFSRFDPQTQLEHTEDRYEVVRDGIIIACELHKRSPATREYSQQQALELFTEAGFVDMNIYQGFSFQNASADEALFSITGKHPDII